MMTFKIAIHHEEHSDGFSKRWVWYCKENGIAYKIVSCYSSDIIKQIEDCDILMWHHDQSNYRDKLFAKQLLYSVELSGKKVFPDFNTGWHFDDKVGQKYLLEAIGAPLVPSYVFYNKKEALKWAETTDYPKVFKLRGGAGSSNVKLVRNRSEAVKLINKAFGRGFSQFNRWGHFKERYNRYKSGRDTLFGVLKGFRRLFVPTEFARMTGNEKGYAYFQKFIPNNDSDIRVIIIGDKAFAIKRLTRENDFRASGSGHIIYDQNEIDIRCVKLAFEINDKIHSQSIGYDFVFDEENNPLVVEISYGFVAAGYDPCPGYWDSELNWHQSPFNPQQWMIEDLFKQLEK